MTGSNINTSHNITVYDKSNQYAPNVSIQDTFPTNQHTKNTNMDNHPPTTTSYVIFGTDFDYLFEPIMLFAWFLMVALTKVAIEKVHKIKSVPEWLKKFPESCVLILLGLITGFMIDVYGEKDDLSGRSATMDFVESLFTNHNFFVYILPPIIFEAGYTVPMRPFTNNALEILIYAILGTFLNTIMVGGTLYFLGQTNFIDSFGIPGGNMGILSYLLYAAIISAVDPVAVLAVFDQIHVNTTLYILVFGESLMNDGVAVVLYKVFEQLLTLQNSPNGSVLELDFVLILTLIGHFAYIVLGGILIGCICGLFTAYMTKFTHHADVMEPIVIFGMAYISYLLAEGLMTSAILAIVFCAFTMRFYVHHNIAKNSDISIHNTGIMLATLTEATIFLNLGLVGAGVLKKWFIQAIPIFGFSLFLCLVYRFVIIFSLTFLINKYYRQNEIKFKDQIIMAYGGLRGGIAFSLMQIASFGCGGGHHGVEKRSLEQEQGSHDTSSFIGHTSSISNNCYNIEQIQGILLCSTLLLVLFTCFIQGTTISYIVDYMHIEKKIENQKRSYFEESAREIITEIMMGVRGIVSSHHGRQYFWFKFDKLKHSYLNKIFERNPESRGYWEKKMEKEFQEVQHEELERLHSKVDKAYNKACKVDEIRGSVCGHEMMVNTRTSFIDQLNFDEFDQLSDDPQELEKQLNEIFTKASNRRRARDSASSSKHSTFNQTYHGVVSNRSKAHSMWVKATANLIVKDQDYHETRSSRSKNRSERSTE